MKGILGVIFSALFLICGIAATASNEKHEGDGERVTILYSHLMSGHLEPCG